MELANLPQDGQEEIDNIDKSERNQVFRKSNKLYNYL